MSSLLAHAFTGELTAAWRAYPLAGGRGFAFRTLYPMHRTTSDSAFATHAENVYVQALADHGLIGLALAAAWVAVIFILAAGPLRPCVAGERGGWKKRAFSAHLMLLPRKAAGGMAKTRTAAWVATGLAAARTLDRRSSRDGDPPPLRLAAVCAPIE